METTQQPVPIPAVAQVERCVRCSAPMEWRHQTWQCPVCRFKLGCCEGQDSCPAD